MAMVFVDDWGVQKLLKNPKEARAGIDPDGKP